jgi:hypothetical protein
MPSWPLASSRCIDGPGAPAAPHACTPSCAARTSAVPQACRLRGRPKPPRPQEPRHRLEGLAAQAATITATRSTTSTAHATQPTRARAELRVKAATCTAPAAAARRRWLSSSTMPTRALAAVEGVSQDRCASRSATVLSVACPIAVHTGTGHRTIASVTIALSAQANSPTGPPRTTTIRSGLRSAHAVIHRATAAAARRPAMGTVRPISPSRGPSRPTLRQRRLHRRCRRPPGRRCDAAGWASADGVARQPSP